MTAADYRLRYSQGDVSPGEFYVEVVPGCWPADGTKAAVPYCPAYGAGAMNLRGFFAYDLLADAGLVVASSDLGDTPPSSIFVGGTGLGGPGVWGNDQAIAKAVALNARLQGPNVGGKTGPAPWLAGSHGAAALCNTLRANPGIASCAAMVIPSVDVEDIRANNRQGYQASIEAAYGGNAAWQAARPTHNPVEYAAALAAVPFLIFSSSNDPICVPSTIAAFAAAHGNTTLVDLGPVGHTMQGVDWQQMTDFVVAHA